MPVGHRPASGAASYSKSSLNMSGGGCGKDGASNMSREAHLKSFNLLEVLGWPAGSDRDRAREARTSTRFGRLGSGARPECRDPQIELFSLHDARTTSNPWVRRRLAPASFRPSYLRAPARTTPLSSRVRLKVPRLESAKRNTRGQTGCPLHYHAGVSRSTTFTPICNSKNFLYLQTTKQMSKISATSRTRHRQGRGDRIARAPLSRKTRNPA